MFYCDDCAKREDWPYTLGGSYGRCEVCEKTARCNDLPSYLLPLPKETNDSASL